MKSKTTTIALSLLVLTLAAGNASATVNVWLDPTDSLVDVGETVDVQLMASFSEPMMAWGMDVTFDDSSIAGLVGVLVESPWDGSDSLDEDGLAGLAFPTAVSGTVTLATLTFEGLSLGSTSITLSHGPEEDEGFMTELGILDQDVTYSTGNIQVTPEPTALALLCLGAMVLSRRRN